MRSVLTALCLFATTAHAVPAQFTHQGRLLDADGIPLEGEATIKFRVADSEEGGTILWEETLTLPMTGGFYAAVLGASDDNPLDTDVLSQAPVWLELQIDGEPAMFPRNAINAVPYATMATVAEEVSGGPVDASQIAVDGTPVVNELGEWVGPAPTINWSDIEGMPEGFADGTDDDTDTDTDTDSFAALGTSCLDGDIPVWDGILTEWACGIDNDTVLTDDEVDAIVADNGYAMESELFSSSFLDLTDVPDGLDDGDDNTQLSESEVDTMVADNGYALAADAFSRLWSDLTGIPDDLADGDDTLTETQVDEMVADNGYSTDADVDALQSRIETLEAQLATLEDAVEEATHSSVGTVMHGNYVIYNSAGLAAIEGFTEVTGNLAIEAGSIPNLDALENLTAVGGNLEIKNNNALTNVDGLSSLSTIGGYFELHGNESMVNIDGLSSLSSVGGHLGVHYNNALVNIDGLIGVTSTGTGTGGDDVYVKNNAVLENVDGLAGLTEVDWDLEIRSNPSLTNIDGVRNITTVANSLWIINNDAMTNVDGLSGLDSVSVRVDVSENDVLTDVSGLHTLTSSAWLTINSNHDLCRSVIDVLRSFLPSTVFVASTSGNNEGC